MPAALYGPLSAQSGDDPDRHPGNGGPRPVAPIHPSEANNGQSAAWPHEFAQTVQCNLAVRQMVRRRVGHHRIERRASERMRQHIAVAPRHVDVRKPR